MCYFIVLISSLLFYNVENSKNVQQIVMIYNRDAMITVQYVIPLAQQNSRHSPHWKVLLGISLKEGTQIDQRLLPVSLTLNRTHAHTPTHTQHPILGCR